jgi:hypothetical protein
MRYDQSCGDELVPDTAVIREFDITSMTLWRWDNDIELGFPSKIKIRRRNYRSRRALEEFKARMLRLSIEETRRLKGAQNSIPRAP